MFILFSILLTLVSVSLRLVIVSLTVLNKVSTKVGGKGSSLEAFSKLAFNPILYPLKVLSFVISRVRDIFTIMGVISVILQVLLYLFIVVTAYSILELFI